MQRVCTYAVHGAAIGHDQGIDEYTEIMQKRIEKYGVEGTFVNLTPTVAHSMFRDPNWIDRILGAGPDAKSSKLLNAGFVSIRDLKYAPTG